jgi:hypothetical protein
MTESTSTSTEGQAPERTERFQRKRGAGFPVVALPEAVGILRKAGRHGNEHSISAFATYLGHSTPNSGSFKRRLAAFRDWKFIASATGDRVVLTDLGRRVAHPTDAAKERSDFQEAFQNCALFWKVYDDSAKDVPISLATLANHGVQLGVSPLSKDQFAQSLSESAVEAGLAEIDGEKVIFIGPGRDIAVELHDSARATDRVYAVADTAYGSGSAGPVRASIGEDVVAAGEADGEEPLPSIEMTPARVSRAGRDAVVEHRQESGGERPALLHQQSWEVGGGSLTVEIRLNQSLPAEAFIQLGKVVAEVERLKALLADGSDTGSEEPTG